MAEYLNDRKIVTHNGAKFQSNTIKRILTNEIYCGFYVRGGVKSKRIEELQIIDDRTFARAQEILRQRKYKQEEKTQIARSAKASTMLSGNVYCAHCGQRMCGSSYVDKYKTKDGVWHNSIRRFRYMCTGAAMKRVECDGQTVYKAQMIDDVVLKVLHECFKKIKLTPKDAAIEKKYKAQIREMKREIEQLEKDTVKLKNKLSELASEIANALIGKSSFSEETLSMAIDNVKEKIAENINLIKVKQNQLDNKEADIQQLDYYYQQFVSWADEFDQATPERKRMIICTVFKEISVGKGYKIEILMDSTYEQFIA